MNNAKVKIAVGNNKIITLKELFRGKEVSRKKMAKLPFSEKLKMLVSLQETALKFGRKGNIVMWRL